MGKRFVLEGEWSGYRSSQQRVCHRTVIPEWQARKLEASGLHTIQFTDGTTLGISVRPARYRERVQEQNQYGSLIDDALRFGGKFVRVADLVKERA